jgi:hypothetical protein
LLDGLPDGAGEVRVVGTPVVVGAQVEHVMPFAPQLVDEERFQGVSPVVCAYGDFHDDP